MTLDESIQGLRLRLMRRAEEIGNVSQVRRDLPDAVRPVTALLE